MSAWTHRQEKFHRKHARRFGGDVGSCWKCAEGRGKCANKRRFENWDAARVVADDTNIKNGFDPPHHGLPLHMVSASPPHHGRTATPAKQRRASAPEVGPRGEAPHPVRSPVGFNPRQAGDFLSIIGGPFGGAA